MDQKLTIFFLVLGYASANEWSTSGGQFCLNKCKYHNDKNYFNWCYVTDPTQTYTVSRDKDYYDSGAINTHMKWDYCVPSHGKAIVLGKDEDEILDKPKYNRELTGKTTLYPTTDCTSECTSMGGQKKTCDTFTDNPQAEGIPGKSAWFYCTDEAEPLVRLQLSAVNKLWCIDRCRTERKDHYWCNTLYGEDHCSPSPDTGSMGNRCSYPCELNKSFLGGEYYFCYTSRDNSTWEHCGFHDIPEEKKHTIEFTTSEYVCADYCRPNEEKEYEWCSYVKWDYNQTSGQSVLAKSWDYCEGSSAPPLSVSTTIIIIVVSIVVLSLIIVGVVFGVRRSG